MDEVKIGDLVQWEAGTRTRVGVVKKVNKDGTCAVSIQVAGTSRQEEIKTKRLTTITSTIRPEND